MLSVSENYSQAIVSDSRNMPYRVKLAGVILDQSKVTRMTVDESVSGSSGVSLGVSNSATLKLTIREADVIDYSGMLVEPESGLVLPDGTIEWVPLGKFWVTDFSTNNDYQTLNLTCADGMYHLTNEYVSNLKYPISIKSVITEIVGMTGIEFKGLSELPDIIVRRKPEEGLTFREVVGYAAGCCGRNARFNRLGQLEFVWYTETGNTIGRELQYLNGATKLNDKPLEVKFEVNGKKETYTVSVVTDGNGGVTANPGGSVLEGETVALSILPFNGYELAEITAVTENGDNVTLYMNTDGGRTFIQPDSNVTVTASFRTSAEGPFEVTVRAYDNGTIYTDLGDTIFEAGSLVTIYVEPDASYEIDRLITTPANLELYNIDGIAHEFTMPQSDVTISAYFKPASVRYTINRSVEYGGAMLVQNASTGEYISEASEGTVVSVRVSPSGGYAFDYFDSDVTLLKVDERNYNFVMPARSVSISAHFKLSEDESKIGMYSWLQKPQSAPTAKPYWAVFYNESEALPTCQKYYLVWFDSWEATKYSDNEYTIQFNGYYYCGSKNNGHGSHEWDTSTWSGNGAPGSTLEWKARVDRLIADWDNYYGPSDQYCLLASNVHLFYNGSMVFKNCESAIQAPQISYLQDGMDVREKGTLTQWLCPDTFSTPTPASNWMVLMPESGLYMTVGEDGKYDVPLTSYPKSLIAFFYDDITIQNLGAIFPNTDEEVYIASFTNARWTYLRDNILGWDEEIHDLPEGAVVGLRSPLVSTVSADGYLDGNSYNFAGVVVTSQTLYDTSGNVFMYNNTCRICDCETAAVFSLKRSVRATVAESVTMSYTNPLIYEKMIPDIANVVQNITYTPMRVKHRGNPAYQAGDIVTVPDKDGTEHTVLIMQQTMTFGGGMNSEITCPGKNEKAISFSSNGPITTQIKREVQASNAALEQRIISSNALVYNALNQSISSMENRIALVTEWQTNKGATKAELKQVSDELGSAIALVVEGKGADASVRADIIMEAINDDSSSITISADKIDLVGKDLSTFRVTIARWTITEDCFGMYNSTTKKGCGLYVPKTNNNSTVLAIGTMKNGLGGTWGDAEFRVNNQGKLTATGADISGKITANEGKIGNWQIVNGLLRFEHEDNVDFFAELAPGGINLNANNGFFNVYTPQDDAFSDDFTIAMAAGRTSFSLIPTKGTMTGDWTFKDQGGRSITLSEIIDMYEYIMI